MTDFKNLEYAVDGAVATITLNRPDAGNAFNKALSDEFCQAVDLCLFDDNVRAVVITGNGKLFCAGGDLSMMADAGNKVDAALKSLTDPIHAAYSTLLRMPKPVIMAVNGAAAGVGLSLALIGDLTIASDKASFTSAYTAAGLSPDGGATYWLPKAIGLKRAKDMMITNRKVSAEEALDWGMVNQIVAADALLDEAQTQAKRLAQGPTGSYGTVKSLVLSSYTESLESQMVHEAEGIANNGKGPNGQEGIAAFLEKRRPNFPG